MLDSLRGTDFVWGFQDESAQRISVRTARLWSIGKPVRRVNSDRVNANTFGFYAVEGNSVVMFPEKSKGEDMCMFLEAVREANGSRKILMILDNGRIHKTKEVFECAKELDIILLFLPPYSPQFNPIELIWKTIKARISGMFLLCREHLVAAVNEYFLEETSKSSYVKAWKERFFNVSSF